MRQISALCLFLISLATPANSQQDRGAHSSGDCSPVLLNNEVGGSLNVSIDCRRARALTKVTIHARLSGPNNQKEYLEEVEVSAFQAGHALSAPADRMATALTGHLHVPQIEPEYPVTLRLDDHGRLTLEQDRRNIAALYVTRFKHFLTLSDLDSPRISVQQMPIDSIIAREGGPEPAERDGHLWRLRAGVYRLVVNAPGYTQFSQLVELGSDGLLRSTEGALRFPLRLLLTRGPGPTIGIYPFVMKAPDLPAASFASLDRRLESALASELDSRRFRTFIAEPQERIAYDPGVSKGDRLLPEMKHADLWIRAELTLH